MKKDDKRPKAGQAKEWLRIEVTGLLIGSFSILALASYGPVGRGIEYVFVLLAGNYYATIGILLFYTAVFLMIKQTVPPLGRRTKGILLLWLIWLGWSSLDLYQTINLGQSHQETSLLKATLARVDNLYGVLTGNHPSDVGLPNASLPGGGLIGLTVFSIFHSLFDVGGTLFFFITLGVISAVLITGVSFGHIWKFITDFLENRVREIREGLSAARESRKSKSENSAAAVGDQASKRITFKKRQVSDTDEDAGSRSPLAAEETESANQQPAPVFPDARPLTIRDFSELVTQTLAKSESAVEKPADSADDLVFHANPEVNDELYEIPPLTLLDSPKAIRGGNHDDIQENARKLETTLDSFGVQVKVTEVHRGPTVTRYELTPAVGVKVSRIVNLSDDLALALAAKDIRIEAPIPGKSAVGIEVPNREVATVTLREVLDSSEFRDAASLLTVGLGRDISGTPIVGNLAKMPHVLVAGATGSGKSVCINGIIASILFKAKPHEVKFIMVDPKMVELNVYNGIPHLMAPVVTDPRRAAYALKKVVAEMEHRYELFAKEGVRNMEGYNSLMVERSQPSLPLIVVIIDELADLMMVAPGDVEDGICRIAQMARAAGIHLIIATQRPSVDVITGVIKANIPSRIAFAVSSQVDSRTILDGAGAEKLLGRGDMLYLPIGESKPVRLQGAFVSDGEVERIVAFVKQQGQATQYTMDLTTIPEPNDNPKIELDDLFWQALKLVVEQEQASVSLVQRRLKVGYSRAARIIDQMEEQGFVGPFEGSKPREVLISKQQFEAQFSANSL